MKCYGIILLAALVGLVAVSSRGEKEATETQPAKAGSVPNFAALDDKAASDAADAIVADRFVMERDLTAQLDSEKTPANRKVLLVYVLGRMRSRQAVASLVKMVDFKAPFVEPKISVGRWDAFPAVEALAEIGVPAVRRIVQVLPKETDAQRVRLMLTVIRQVEGQKPGLAWLENALAGAKDDTEKENLRNAIKQYGGPASS